MRGFFCSVFPLGLSYDPYAGTLTKRGTWENVSRALEVVRLRVCVFKRVCECKSVLTSDVACSAYLLRGRWCVCVCTRAASRVHDETQPKRTTVLAWLIFSKGLKSLISSETPNPL